MSSSRGRTESWFPRLLSLHGRWTTRSWVTSSSEAYSQSINTPKVRRHQILETPRIPRALKHLGSGEVLNLESSTLPFGKADPVNTFSLPRASLSTIFNGLSLHSSSTALLEVSSKAQNPWCGEIPAPKDRDRGRLRGRNTQDSIPYLQALAS